MNAPRRFLPDPAFDAGSLVYPVKQRGWPGRLELSDPLILAGVPGGEIRITNRWLPKQAMKLYRFATLTQAYIAADVVHRHARLSDDGYAWQVADVADHRPIHDVAGALAKLEQWARRVEPEIRDALTGWGPGHYSLLHRQEPRQ